MKVLLYPFEEQFHVPPVLYNFAIAIDETNMLFVKKTSRFPVSGSMYLIRRISSGYFLSALLPVNRTF